MTNGVSLGNVEIWSGIFQDDSLYSSIITDF